MAKEINTKFYSIFFIILGIIIVLLAFTSCTIVKEDEYDYDETEFYDPEIETENYEEKSQAEDAAATKRLEEEKEELIVKEEGLTDKEKSLKIKEDYLKRREEEIEKARRDLIEDHKQKEQEIEKRLDEIDEEKDAQQKKAYNLALHKKIEEELRGSYPEGYYTESPADSRFVYEGNLPVVDVRSAKIIDEERASNINHLGGGGTTVSIMRDMYHSLYRQGKYCCAYNTAQTMKRTNVHDKLIYKFLVDDINFYNSYNRCIFMSDEDVHNTFDISETAFLIKNIRNECVCNNKEKFLDKIKIFEAVYCQTPSFKNKQLTYKIKDDFGRIICKDVNRDIQVLKNLLRRCP